MAPVIEAIKANAAASGAVSPITTSYAQRSGMNTPVSFGNLSRSNNINTVLPNMLSNSSSGNTSQHNYKMNSGNSGEGKNYTAEHELKHSSEDIVRASAALANNKVKLKYSPSEDKVEISTSPEEKKEGLLSKLFGKKDKNPMGNLPNEETMLAALNAARLENPNLDGILKDIEKATA